MNLKMTYSNSAFRANGLVLKRAYDDDVEMKKGGWKKDQYNGANWFTTSVTSAVLLRDHADERAERIFKHAYITHSPWKGALVVPKGLSLKDFQTPAVYYALSRSRCYLALDPGLGKTIIAAIIAATYGKQTVITCPPFLIYNTLVEFQKWAPTLRTKIIGRDDWDVPDVLIVPDSQVGDKCLYQYLHRVVRPRVLFGDEFHRFKTPKKKRTNGMLGRTFRGKYEPGLMDIPTLERKIPMSGTPMPNRPIELFTMLKKLAPEHIDFMSYDEYGMHYCKGKWNGFGYDYLGANERALRTLANRMEQTSVDKSVPRSFMLRLRKGLLNLPPIVEEPLILSDDMPKDVKDQDAELIKKYRPEDLIKYDIARSLGVGVEDLHMSTYRRMLGLAKLRASVEYIKDVLETTDEKVLIFCIYKETVAALRDALAEYNPTVITAATKVEERQRLVNEFQMGYDGVFIGSWAVMGVGYTLTVVDRICAVEFPWDPGTCRQGFDRVHRMGLDHSVLAQYFIFKDSIDHKTFEVNVKKKRITAII